MGEIYRSSAHEVRRLIDSPSVRNSEIKYLTALGNGVGAWDRAADLTEAITDTVLIAQLDKESVIALASYLSTVRLLAKLADAESSLCLIGFGNQLVDTDVLVPLAQFYCSESEALGDPAQTTLHTIEHLAAAGDTGFVEAPALLLLRWALATGYLIDHAAEIRFRVKKYREESIAFSGTVDCDIADFLQ